MKASTGYLLPGRLGACIPPSLRHPAIPTVALKPRGPDDLWAHGNSEARTSSSFESNAAWKRLGSEKRPCSLEGIWLPAKSPTHSSKLGEERASEWPLVAPSHAVIEIEDGHLDLVSGVVTREMRHLQHVNDAARISVAPFDQLTQDMIEV